MGVTKEIKGILRWKRKSRKRTIWTPIWMNSENQNFLISPILFGNNVFKDKDTEEDEKRKEKRED